MSFDGPALSFDDEGSILFDGENIIVTVPVGHEALDHLGAEEDIPFPVVYTHPSHAQNQQPSPDMPPTNNHIFNHILNKEKAKEHNERARQEREAARNAQSQSEVQVIPVIPADLARDVVPEIVSEEPVVREDWHDTTPLTHLQVEYVDHLLDVETDPLAREVLIALKRDGLPPRSEWNDFMAQYALFSWDTESDAQAWATLAIIAESDWDEWLELVDLQHESERQPDPPIGMGGGPGDTNVDDANITNLVSRYQELEDHVKSEFGILIEWGKGSDDMRSRLTQLQKLDRAIDYIIYYLTWRVYNGDESTALDVFRRLFGRSEDHGQLVVQLGADAYFVEVLKFSKDNAEYYGFVPLPPPGAKSVEGVDDSWDMMFLGSNVDIATIVHEFGHVIDRSLDIVQEYNAAANKGRLLPAWRQFYADAGLLLTDSILQYGIVGLAGKQNVNEEFWADLFMTAMLDSVVGGPLKVYSSTYERIKNLSGNQFDHCKGEDPCRRRDVEWADPPPDAILDFGALAREHFPALLNSLLNG